MDHSPDPAAGRATPAPVCIARGYGPAKLPRFSLARTWDGPEASRPRAGQFLLQPEEAGEVVPQDLLGIEMTLVINNPDRAPVATLDHGPEHGQFVPALAQVQDLWFRSWVHPVEVETVEVGLHQLEDGGPVADVVVPVMPVVDNPDLLVA